ncbi:MAG TPA: F0F1 ATP synthase subunit gamma [Actinomycetales bacterium]|nr:F0F1 ATP synthase subunit gamma [Actinomycetales bacterium]
MSASQRVYRQRISSTKSLQQMFSAMELIAASRIGKARDRAEAARPYVEALTRAVSAVATHSDAEHPLVQARTETNRAALLLLTSDRGMAGAYSANVIREAERLTERLEGEGKEVVRYVVGQRGVSYFRFRDIPMQRYWVGNTDAPQAVTAKEIADELLNAFSVSAEEGGVDQLHIVDTRFINMVTQEPRVVRMLPLEIVEGVAEPGDDPLPLYDFEPSAQEVLDAVLPRYVESRIWNALLQAAASELAARQRAMHTATENAEDLIREYTRLANAARQSEITQEISEIVSGADALAAS